MPAGPLLRAFQHRNYRLFFGGQLVSLCGTWMQSVAQQWLVYRLTDSSLLLGLVGFCTQFPVFVFASYGGTLADRHSRRRLLVYTALGQMLLATALATLTLTGAVRVVHIFVLATALGCVNAVDIPVRQSFVVEMVGKKDLMNAIALNSSMVNGARIVGPAIAGILVASIGEGYCFLVNALTFLAVIFGLLAMRGLAALPAKPKGGTWAHVREGLGYVASTGPMRVLLLLMACSSMCGIPYAVLMPIFASKILHGGPRTLGLLMGSSGCGALLGALTLARRTHLVGLERWIGIGAASFGGSLLLFSQSRWMWLSMLLLVPTGYSMMVQLSATNTLLQAMVPDRLRGRVMAVYSMMFMGMAPIGSLLAGVLTRWLSAPTTVALGGAACIAGAMIYAARFPAHRAEAGQLLQAAQE